MKNTKKAATKNTSSRTWNKEDYYEYMDVALDAHNPAKHTSVHNYAQSRRKIDVEEAVTQPTVSIASMLHGLVAHKAQPRHQAASAKIRA